MRDHSQHIELSRQEAVEGILAALPASFGEGAPEHIPIDDAYGRVLAADVLVKTDIPNVLTCCMDSVALHWDAVADLPEGTLPDTSSWVRGVDWEFANTGVAMPEGFDTAVVIEHVDVAPDEQSIVLKALPSQRFAGTRSAGSQKKKGDVAVAAGSVITPDVAAAIVSAGHGHVDVHVKPRVAFLPTGNELVPANLPFAESVPQKFAGRGKVYESNSAVVKGKVEAWGGTFVGFDIVPDEREAIRDAIHHALKVADIVILNAGSSKGSDDWSVEILEEEGQVICHQTNHGPGHHSSYTLVDGKPVVGISGPSGGASITLNFYLLPLMKQFLGHDPAPMTVPVKLAAEFPAGKMSKLAAENPKKLAGEQRPPEATKPKETFYSIKMLCLSLTSDAQLVATPLKGHPGSEGAKDANAYYLLPAGAYDMPPAVGDIIEVELL